MDLSGRTLLGKYRIEGLLGQGGMGSVWKGAHVVTGRRVAIKVLDERFLSNVNVVQRFGREARAASAIQHEGIVEVLDLDQTEEGLPFLVMEFLEGETLSKRIERKGKLSQDETARIATLLLEALQAAHDHGVIHRDLKPDNIFLVPAAGRRGEVLKILDFGISHKDDEAQAKLTMTGSVLGTPHYMSPEQAMGETNLDRRVDIYGAGVVLYECVVGDVPFDAPNYNKLLRVILDEEAVPPTQRGAMIEPRFERVILDAIDKDRDRRPQTVAELLAALKAATSDETERFGPDMVARLAAAGARDRGRSPSASFAKPGDPSATSSSALPAVPSARSPAQASGVRGRSDAQLPAHAAAVNDDLEFDGPIGSLPVPASQASRSPSGSLDLGAGGLGSLDAPRIGPAPARAPALRLDAPKGGGGGLGGLDDLDALAPGGGVSLEIDESALARPKAVEPGPTAGSSPSGRYRALSLEPERIAPTRTTPARTTPARTTPARTTPASGSQPAVRAPEAATSSAERKLPAGPGGLPAGHLPAPAAVPPSRRTLRDRWDDLPEPVRRWGPIVVAGVLVFVVVVAIVRSVVRPHGDAESPEGGAVIDPVGGPPHDPTRPEWVLIEVDGVPPGATLRLDGLPGATLPLRVRRGGSHVLVITAPGYQERRLVFDAEANTHLRADMRPSIGTGQGI